MLGIHNDSSLQVRFMRNRWTSWEVEQLNTQRFLRCVGITLATMEIEEPISQQRLFPA